MSDADTPTDDEAADDTAPDPVTPTLDELPDESNLTAMQSEVVRFIVSSDTAGGAGASKHDIADHLDISPHTAKSHIRALRKHGVDVRYHASEKEYFVHSLSDVDLVGPTTTREDLEEREEYIYRRLPESVDTLAADLGVAPAVVEAHIDTIVEKGWHVDDDGAGNYYGTDHDHLRSSEHKGTRTKKANAWWQKTHDKLAHEFQQLDWPSTETVATPGHEDWVLHFTDLHVGDEHLAGDGSEVFTTDTVPDIVEYVTERSIHHARSRNREYDTAYLLWGGDMVTNEGIYDGQFEDLHAWLDEQLEVAAESLLGQVVAFAEEFDQLVIVCQIGNHGDIRASGTTRQANADLILYKWIRNVVASVQKWADVHPFENVEFLIGEARNYRDFTMRGGALNGHLRHGQDAKPQATTSAGSNKWRGYFLDHEFDVAFCGHWHTSGKVPWNGPPIFYSGSPKPAGDYVESFGGRMGHVPREIATSCAFDDDGLTASHAIDTRYYTPTHG